MPPGLGKSLGNPDNDDYVAQVLAEEARDSSLKYSAHGMGAYLPRRPTGTAPKPNTRFLRHIIKETDTHNAALKRKEEREARERMRQLKSQTSRTSQSSGKDNRHHRSDSRDSRRERRNDRGEKHRSHRRRDRTRSPASDREGSHKSGRKREPRDSDDDRRRRPKKSHRRRSYSRSQSRSPYTEREPNSRNHRRRYRKRSSSPLRARSRSPDSRRRDQGKAKESGSSRRWSPLPPSLTNEIQPSGYESDPLEDLVGPLPPKEHTPIRSRGRGAYNPKASDIDAHFASDYDPTFDVQAEEEDLQATKPARRPVPGLMTGDDDWELALEALRDRARWKQKGEERLREAGFNHDVVERWKSSTSPTKAADSEGRLNEVKWSSKSEGREWDRGKFVDADGHIDVKASW